MKQLSFVFYSIFLVFGSVIAQKRNIHDYYTLLKPKLMADVLPENTIAIDEQDLRNGYLKAHVEPISMGTPVYEMALWRDARGNPLIGIFTYGCGGLGCSGDLTDLKFYNAEMQDITDRVVDIGKVANYFKQKIGQDLREGGAVVAIPKIGTTITIRASEGFYGNSLGNTGVDLVYNPSSNKFSMVQK